VKGNHVKPVEISEEQKNQPQIMRCQGTGNCEGTQAVLVRVFDVESDLGYAGRKALYRCLTCNQFFDLRY
jgi:hypothetical protein